MLIALSICAVTNSTAKLALEQLPKMKGSEVHLTVILSEIDERVFKELGTNITMDAVYQQSQRLYHK